MSAVASDPLERRTSVAASPSPARVAATALGVVVALEVVRVFLPSILFVFGRAGSTPATTMAAYGLIPFAVAFLVAVVVRRTGPAGPLLATAGLLGAARLWVQGTDGGDPQLLASTVAAAAALSWLVTAAAGVDRRAAALGAAIGLAGDAALHGLLRGADLPWRDGTLPWVLAAVLVGAFLVATWASRPERGERAGWGWIALGPALVLHGVIGGVPSRLQAVTGWSEVAAVAVVVGSQALAVLFAVRVVSRADRAGGWAAAGLVALGAAGAFVGGDPGAVASHVALGVGVGPALAVALARGRPAVPGRAAVAAATGLVLFFLLAFLYYGGYDVALPFENEVSLAVTAAVLAGAAIFTGRRPGPGWRLRAAPIAAGAAVLLAGASLGTWLQADPPEPRGEGGLPVRVMTYNLHMGFDTAGRFDIEALAEVIREESPDVVALQEVARGWFTNGSTDVLPRLAELTGLPYVFAPAADEVWGNAILSRFPLEEVTSEELPRGGAAMRRSYLAAVARLGDGSELGIVATHLHHVEDEGDIRLPQAEVVARVAAELAAGGRPVVVMGDLNAEPGAPELAPLASLVDVVSPLGDVATWPSSDPIQHIDHILVAGGLAASDLSVPRSEASDHLGIAVTLSGG
ncbi:MAG: endonuclease/exonuclease/phosphatase family protein [Actinobacteria bacterium]|nr:endonuclease/exonuclease/phosphatase family protein [Actinomycetota bacterium]